MPKELPINYISFYMTKAVLMERFFFPFSLDEVKNYNVVGIRHNNLVVNDNFQIRDERKLKFFFQKKFRELKTILDNKPAVYLYAGLDIPLVGLVEIGIIDRGTNVIEVRPITGCNLRCRFCSVAPRKRERNFVIEPSFLIKELKAVLQIKRKKVSVFINSQGEPLLYSPLAEFIKEIKQLNSIKEIALVTNGTLLTKERIDELKNSGLNFLFVSLHSLDRNKAKRLNGGFEIDPERIFSNLLYAQQKGILVALTPVVIFGENEKDVEEMAKKAALYGLRMLPQNYLVYRFGEHYYKERSFEYFYNWFYALKEKIGEEVFHPLIKIEEDNALPNPFLKGKIERIPILFPGFFKGEAIGVLHGRLISVIGGAGKKVVKAKIIRTKHNIITAKSLR